MDPWVSFMLPGHGKHQKQFPEEEIKGCLVGERRFGRTTNKIWGKKLGKFFPLWEGKAIQLNPLEELEE